MEFAQAIAHVFSSFTGPHMPAKGTKAFTVLSLGAGDQTALHPDQGMGGLFEGSSL